MRPRVILVLATLAAYWNSLSAGLPFDSVALVQDDPRMSAWSWHNVGLILSQNYWGTRFASGLYRPAVTLSYLLQHGAPMWAYHAVNLGLHLAAVLLAYRLIQRVSPRTAFWAALIWAVHPVNTEAVTNAAGRPDLLAAIAVLGGLLLYLRSGFDIVNYRWPVQRRATLLALGAVTFLGVCSKESAVVLLPLALLLGWSTRRPPDGAIWAISIPIGFMLLVRAGLSISCGMVKPFVDNPVAGAPWFIGKLTAVKVLGKLLLLWIWPATLSADYSYNQVPLWAGQWLIAWLAALLALLIIWATRRRTAAAFWVLFVFVAWLPTSNLIVTTGSIMAERFLYLPGIGLAALLVLGIQWLPSRTAFLALLAFCVLFATRTFVRNQDYRDDLTFWAATVETSPNSFKAHTQLAVEFYKRGHPQAAVAEAEEAIRILDPLPDSLDSYEPWAEFFHYYQAVGDQKRAHEIGWRVAQIFNAAPKCKRCLTPDSPPPDSAR